jgi:hypothetical protein
MKPATLSEDEMQFLRRRQVRRVLVLISYLFSFLLLSIMYI